MTAAKLRLLRILALQHIANAIQELQIRLVGVLLDRRDEGPRHGTRSLRRNRRVRARLVVSATTPQDHVRWARFGPLRLLVRLVAVHRDRCELLQRAEDAARVAPGVCHAHLEEVLACFFREIRFFERALRGVYIGQIHDRARVTAVENAGHPNTGFQRGHTDGMDLVVNNMSILNVIDRVYDFVVTVVLVAIEIFCLAAMSWKSEKILAIRARL